MSFEMAVFEYESWEKIKSWKFEKAQEQVVQVRFSPDGEYIALAVSSRLIVFDVFEEYAKK